MPELATDPLSAGLGESAYTVLYCYPGTALPGIDGVPGGPGCTLESCTYRDRLDGSAGLLTPAVWLVLWGVWQLRGAHLRRTMRSR